MMMSMLLQWTMMQRRLDESRRIGLVIEVWAGRSAAWCDAIIVG
jgi:hypothetical protein